MYSESDKSQLLLTERGLGEYNLLLWVKSYNLSLLSIHGARKLLIVLDGAGLLLPNINNWAGLTGTLDSCGKMINFHFGLSKSSPDVAEGFYTAGWMGWEAFCAKLKCDTSGWAGHWAGFQHERWKRSISPGSHSIQKIMFKCVSCFIATCNLLQYGLCCWLCV